VRARRLIDSNVAPISANATPADGIEVALPEDCHPRFDARRTLNAPQGTASLKNVRRLQSV
jgi:hypothetical protein